MVIVHDAREQAGYAFAQSPGRGRDCRGREPAPGRLYGDLVLPASACRGARERLAAIVKASDAARPVQ